MPVPAVFFDRDGTLIDDPGYLRDPDGVRLAPGAAEAVCRLRQAGYRIIVVTNQSGVARGLLDESTLEVIHERMKRLFAEEEAAIDAIYYCPYLDGDEAVVERYRRDSDLRKPRPGMYLLAAKEHDIDLAASWSIGDSARDSEAGKAAGCRTIQLVRGELPQGDGGSLPHSGLGGGSHKGAASVSAVDFCFHTLIEATDCILTHGKAGRSGSGGQGGEQRSPSARPAPLEGEGASAFSPPAGRPECHSREGGNPDPSVSARSHLAGRSERLLEEIAEHIRVWQRQRSMEDFTLAKLAGVVAQLVAVGMAFWAMMAMIDPSPEAFPSHRWLAAIFLQLVALTFFHLHRQR